MNLGKEWRGRDTYGVWDGHVHTPVFKMVNHRELCSMLRGNLDGRGV